MILALVFSAITLAVTAALVWPLFRRHTKAGHEKRDIVVYREQLAEIDNDIERGLLTKAQAEAVRTEIHRRILGVEDAELAAAHAGQKAFKPATRRIFAIVIAIILPTMAGVLYVTLGAPELPSKPYTARANDPEFALASTVADMQSKLEKTPNAGGYKHLADTLYMMKRYTASTEAYQKAIDLGQNDAVTWSEMGESVVLANDGSVVPESMVDFYKALKLDSKDARARFYIGLGEAQINNFRKAVAIWKDLQKDSSPDAPWFTMVKEHIDAYAKEGGFHAASIQPAAPVGQSPHGSVSTHAATADKAETSAPTDAPVNGQSMPDWAKDPKKREAMIKSMVDGLAAKLEKNHSDVQGWMKLANAYRVMGEPAKAQKALNEALQYNPDNGELKSFAESFSRTSGK